MRYVVILCCAMLSQSIWAQPVERPLWSVGDTWTYRNTQLPHWSSSRTVVSQFAMRVDRVNSDHYVLFRTEMDEQGNVTAEPVRQRWSPGLNRLSYMQADKKWQEFFRYKWPMQPGEEWKAPYIGSDYNTEWTVEATRWEDVTVPAGTFRALRIELSRTEAGGRRAVKREWHWYSPEVKRDVRFEEKGATTSYVYNHRVEELIRYSPAAQQPDTA